MKFLLFVLAFASFGCRTALQKPSPAIDPDFYSDIIENECAAGADKTNLACCVESVRYMERRGLLPLPDGVDRCPDGERVWSRPCRGSLRWCSRRP